MKPPRKNRVFQCPNLYFFKLTFIGVWLIYNAVLISAV